MNVPILILMAMKKRWKKRKKQVHSSDGSSDEYEETDGDNTVNNDNKLKEKNETLMNETSPFEDESSSGFAYEGSDMHTFSGTF
ncbi:hypothetical protein OIU76_015339 [Salix suchowensis]|nr:hypothetical protein OIU76_015339 [Salix suchowensis]